MSYKTYTMLKILKFFFWLLATLILAYFMTDIKVSGKTLKEHIDSLIRSEKTKQVKQQVDKWFDQKTGSGQEKEKPEIKEEESKKLEKVIQKNQ